jgi:aspartate aminotransferase
VRLADRIQQIEPSATLAIAAKAKAMKARGIDVISFGAGEPDFDTPQHIKDAAVQALVEGYTHYTPVGGIEELRQAVCRRCREDYDLNYDPSQVIVCCGAKHAVYNAAMVLFQPGDEVLIPGPYWVSYPDILILTGAVPVVLPTTEETHFKVTPEQIQAAATPKTRAILLNSPNNPTGALYLRPELEAIGRVLQEHDLLVIADDIYDKIVYNDIRSTSIASIWPGLQERTLLINGVSKAYAMTGWRIGYAVGPEPLIAAMMKIQGQSTSAPAAMAQKAAAEALSGPQDCVRGMVEEFDRRRRFVVYRLNEMEGVSCFEPGGAFYAFPRIDSYFGRRWGEKTIGTAADLATFLLEEAQVALVPGEPFGSERHIRLSFACSMDDIEEGLNRIEVALAKLE